MEKAKIYAKLSKELEWGIAEDPLKNLDTLCVILTNFINAEVFARNVSREMRDLEERKSSIGLGRVRVELLVQEPDVRDGFIVQDVWEEIFNTDGHNEFSDKVIELLKNDFAPYVEKSFALTWDMPKEVWDMIYAQARHSLQYGDHAWRHMLTGEDAEEFAEIEVAYLDAVGIPF